MAAESKPHIALRDRLYAALRHEKSCTCGECSSGLNAVDDLFEQLEAVRQIILRGWDDHMWNFENMDTEDEDYLLTWAGHPSAPDPAKERS